MVEVLYGDFSRKFKDMMLYVINEVRITEYDISGDKKGSDEEDRRIKVD